MYDGSIRRVELIQAGEALMGDDGTPRIVKHGSIRRGNTARDAAAALRDQSAGLAPAPSTASSTVLPATYRITSSLKHHASWTCNGDHILVLRLTDTAPIVEQTRSGRWSIAMWRIRRRVDEEGRVVSVPFRHRIDMVFHCRTSAESFLRHDRTHLHTEPSPLLEWEASVNEYVQYDPELQAACRMFTPAHVKLPSDGAAVDPQVRARIDALHARSPSPCECSHAFTVSRVAHADYFGFTLVAADGGRCNGRLLLADLVVSHNTETAKMALRYFTGLSSTAASASGSSGTPSCAVGGSGSGSVSLGHIERQLMQSNPLLEAFGNCRTIRNNNSSRFGKYIRVHFNTTNSNSTAGQAGTAVASAGIRTAEIAHYLLERSRVVSPAANERNFHCMYQLICGVTDPALRASLFLPASVEDSYTSFVFLNQSGCTTIAGLDDAAEFAATQRAMESLGLSATEQSAVWKILAAVLQMGNVSVQTRADSVAAGDASNAAIPKVEVEKASMTGADATLTAAGSQHLSNFASLLGFPSSQSLAAVVLSRTNQIRGEKFVVPFSVSQAKESRESIAKQLYVTLFDWLLHKVNRALAGDAAASASSSTASSAASGPFIGLLDIFGFEHFLENSLEQLLINFANEKIQQFYLARCFKDEVAMMVDQGLEGVELKVEDNADRIAVLESRLGLFSLLNEECVFPKGSDASFVSKLLTTFAKSPIILPDAGKAGKAHAGSSRFVVVHYAGAVTYEAHGFLAKNKDAVSAEVAEVLRASTEPEVAAILRGAPTTEDAPSPAAAAAAASTHGSNGHAAGHGHHGHHASHHGHHHTPTKHNTGTLPAASPPAKAASTFTGASGSFPVRGASSSITSPNATGSSSAASSSSAGKGSQFIAQKFRDQLIDLISVIQSTSTHFIRCIKPCSELAPGIFTGAMVLKQLKNAGVMDAVRIRQKGFPFRLDFATFLTTYSSLLDKADRLNGMLQPRDKCIMLLEQQRALNREVLTSGSFAVGRSKVLLRDAAHAALEARNAVFRHAAATKIQMCSRRHRVQRKVARRVEAERLRLLHLRRVVVLQSLVRRFLATKHTRELKAQTIKRSTILQSLWRRHAARKRYLVVRDAHREKLRLEAEAAAAAAEAERIRLLEEERLWREEEERQRLAELERQRLAELERLRLEAEAEAERLRIKREAEEAERKRIEAEAAAAAAAAAEAARLQREQEEREAAAAAAAEAARLQKFEEERLAAEAAAAEAARVQQAQSDAESAAAAQAESDRLAAEAAADEARSQARRAEALRLAAEAEEAAREESARLAKLEANRIAQEKARARLLAEAAEQEREDAELEAAALMPPPPAPIPAVPAAASSAESAPVVSPSPSKPLPFMLRPRPPTLVTSPSIDGSQQSAAIVPLGSARGPPPLPPQQAGSPVQATQGDGRSTTQRSASVTTPSTVPAMTRVTSPSTSSLSPASAAAAAAASGVGAAAAVPPSPRDLTSPAGRTGRRASLFDSMVGGTRNRSRSRGRGSIVAPNTPLGSGPSGASSGPAAANGAGSRRGSLLVPLTSASAAKGLGQNLTLVDVLEQPAYRAALRSYLEAQLCAESLDFIEAVESWDRKEALYNTHVELLRSGKKEDADLLATEGVPPSFQEMLSLAAYITREFVVQNAPRQINIDSSTRLAVMAQYDALVAAHGPGAGYPKPPPLALSNLFKAPAFVIYRMLDKDVFVRFQASSFYTGMLSASVAASLTRGEMLKGDGWVNENGYTRITIQVIEARDLPLRESSTTTATVSCITMLDSKQTKSKATRRCGAGRANLKWVEADAQSSFPLRSTTQYVEVHLVEKGKTTLTIGRVIAPLQMVASPFQPVWHKIVPIAATTVATAGKEDEIQNLGELRILITLAADPDSTAGAAGGANGSAASAGTATGGTDGSTALTSGSNGLDHSAGLRFTEDGFNLDLTYVLDRLLAMAYPPESVAGSKTDVCTLLEQRHRNCYKVYNLCSLREGRTKGTMAYPSSKFLGRVLALPSEEKAPPSFGALLQFVQDAHAWLQAHPQNVAAVHCKVGRGRVGSAICAYLLWSGHSASAADALDFFAVRRAPVSLPSQARCVHYMDRFLAARKAAHRESLHAQGVIIDGQLVMDEHDPEFQEVALTTPPPLPWADLPLDVPLYLTRVTLHDVPKNLRDKKLNFYFQIFNSKDYSAALALGAAGGAQGGAADAAATLALAAAAAAAAAASSNANSSASGAITGPLPTIQSDAKSFPAPVRTKSSTAIGASALGSTAGADDVVVNWSWSLDHSEDLLLSGDVRMAFWRHGLMSADFLWSLAFHTAFVEMEPPSEGQLKPTKGRLVLRKAELDRAHKDTEHKLFPKGMQLELRFDTRCGEERRADAARSVSPAVYAPAQSPSPFQIAPPISPAPPAAAAATTSESSPPQRFSTSRPPPGRPPPLPFPPKRSSVTDEGAADAQQANANTNSMQALETEDAGAEQIAAPVPVAVRRGPPPVPSPPLPDPEENNTAQKPAAAGASSDAAPPALANTTHPLPPKLSAKDRWLRNSTAVSDTMVSAMREQQEQHDKQQRQSAVGAANGVPAAVGEENDECAPPADVAPTPPQSKHADPATPPTRSAASSNATAPAGGHAKRPSIFASNPAFAAFRARAEGNAAITASPASPSKPPSRLGSVSSSSGSAAVASPDQGATSRSNTLHTPSGGVASKRNSFIAANNSNNLASPSSSGSGGRSPGSASSLTAEERASRRSSGNIAALAAGLAGLGNLGGGGGGSLGFRSRATSAAVTDASTAESATAAGAAPAVAAIEEEPKPAPVLTHASRPKARSKQKKSGTGSGGFTPVAAPSTASDEPAMPLTIATVAAPAAPSLADSSGASPAPSSPSVVMHESSVLRDRDHDRSASMDLALAAADFEEQQQEQQESTDSFSSPSMLGVPSSTPSRKASAAFDFEAAAASRSGSRNPSTVERPKRQAPRPPGAPSTPSNAAPAPVSSPPPATPKASSAGGSSLEPVSEVGTLAPPSLVKQNSLKRPSIFESNPAFAALRASAAAATVAAANSPAGHTRLASVSQSGSPAGVHSRRTSLSQSNGVSSLASPSSASSPNAGLLSPDSASGTSLAAKRAALFGSPIASSGIGAKPPGTPTSTTPPATAGTPVSSRSQQETSASPTPTTPSSANSLAAPAAGSIAAKRLSLFGGQQQQVLSPTSGSSTPSNRVEVARSRGATGGNISALAAGLKGIGFGAPPPRKPKVEQISKEEGAGSANPIVGEGEMSMPPATAAPQLLHVKKARMGHRSRAGSSAAEPGRKAPSSLATAPASVRGSFDASISGVANSQLTAQMVVPQISITDTSAATTPEADATVVPASSDPDAPSAAESSSDATASATAPMPTPKPRPPPPRPPTAMVIVEETAEEEDTAGGSAEAGDRTSQADAAVVAESPITADPMLARRVLPPPPRPASASAAPTPTARGPPPPPPPQQVDRMRAASSQPAESSSAPARGPPKLPPPIAAATPETTASPTAASSSNDSPASAGTPRFKPPVGGVALPLPGARPLRPPPSSPAGGGLQVPPSSSRPHSASTPHAPAAEPSSTIAAGAGPTGPLPVRPSRPPPRVSDPPPSSFSPAGSPGDAAAPSSKPKLKLPPPVSAIVGPPKSAPNAGAGVGGAASTPPAASPKPMFVLRSAPPPPPPARTPAAAAVVPAAAPPSLASAPPPMPPKRKVTAPASTPPPPAQ